MIAKPRKVHPPTGTVVRLLMHTVVVASLVVLTFFALLFAGHDWMPPLEEGDPDGGLFVALDVMSVVAPLLAATSVIAVLLTKLSTRRQADR